MNNETPDNPNQTPASDQNTGSLGESWKTLRESKGISLETIAQQTNIPMRKIEALESKDFDSLGSETFALGYIRRYAKILQMDPDVFIDTYKASRPSGDLTEIPSAGEPLNTFNKVDEQPNLTKKKIPLMPIAISVIVIWGLAMVFIGGGKETADSKSPAPVMSQESEQSSIDEGSLVEKDKLPLEDPVTSELDTEAAGVETPVEENVSPYMAEPERPQRPPQMDESASTSVMDNLVEPSDDASVEVVQSGSAEDVIMMSFSDDCWVEVEDANGDVIFAQLQLKGDNLQIFGQAPFGVMLGNARAVTLTINGREVSTTPPGAQKTLRMTLRR